MGRRVMEESLVGGGLGRLRCENKPRVNEEIGARGTGRVTLRYVREFIIRRDTLISISIIVV
jgi:hypothetical protein